jgi:hypothetical protein
MSSLPAQVFNLPSAIDILQLFNPAVPLTSAQSLPNKRI